MTSSETGLPPLAGRIGASVRAACLAFLALTLAMLAYGGWLSARDFFSVIPNNLAFGFATGTGSAAFPDPDQVRVYMATSDAARRSGIRPNDVIVAIEGRPVPARATEHLIGDMMGAVSGDVATVITRSTDGQVRTHRLPRQQDAWSAEITGTGLNGWQRSAILFGAEQLRMIFLFAAAVLLFRRRKRDPVAALFGVACLAMCHQGNNSFWFWHMAGWLDARSWASLIQFLCLAVGLNAFPDGRFAPRWTKWLAAAAVPAIVGAYLLARYGIVARTLPSWLIIAILLVSVGGLVQRYRASPLGAERQQIKWAVAGFVGYVFLLLAAWIPSALGVPLSASDGPVAFIWLIILSNAMPLTVAAGLLVSLLRYRLYDADAAISRSASYSFLTVAMVTLFAVSKQAIEILGERYFEGNAAALSGGIAAGLAAVMITPLHHRVTHWTETRFQKPLVALRRGLPELVGDLRETAGVDLLARAVLERVEHGIRSVRSALVVDGTVVAARGVEAAAAQAWLQERVLPADDRLVRDQGDPLFPVRVPLRQEGAAETGWILLGPRPDGSLYGRDERAALADVKGPVARALHIARQREEKDASEARNVARLVAEVAGLGRRVDSIERTLQGPAAAAAAE